MLSYSPLLLHSYVASGRSRNFEMAGREDNVSDLSLFIANAHNELDAFSAGK